MPTKQFGVDYDPATLPLDGTETLSFVQSGVMVDATTQDIADLGGGGASYLKYVALLSQSGTDAPVATVLENTLGGTVVWSYDTIGSYFATLSNAFTSNKTWANVATSAIGSDYVVNIEINSVNDFVIKVNDDNAAQSDDWGPIYIEIRVYP